MRARSFQPHEILGTRALRHPVEGAEDDANAADRELRERGLRLGDVVVSISASGRTPLDWARYFANDAAMARLERQMEPR